MSGGNLAARSALQPRTGSVGTEQATWLAPEGDHSCGTAPGSHRTSLTSEPPRATRGGRNVAPDRVAMQPIRWVASVDGRRTQIGALARRRPDRDRGPWAHSDAHSHVIPTIRTRVGETPNPPAYLTDYRRP